MDKKELNLIFQDWLYERELARTRRVTLEEKHLLLGLRDLSRKDPYGKVEVVEEMVRDSPWLTFIDDFHGKNRRKFLVQTLANLEEQGYVEIKDDRERGQRCWNGTIKVSLARSQD